VLGIDLKEVRVVGDEERAIVDALNALRHRYRMARQMARLPNIFGVAWSAE
jgi:hypothetical protein